MRISPVGYFFDNESDVIKNARLVTITSHNTEEAITGSTIVALIIFYLRKGFTREEIFKMLNLRVEYKPFNKFNTTVNETLNNCLYAFYVSNSFEDAIRKTLLMGGDTDTYAAIVGSMAEALYKMNNKQNYKKILNKVY